MKESARIFFFVMQDDVKYHSEDLAKRVRAVLPDDFLKSMTPDQHKSLIAALNEGMEHVVASFFVHFDNVGAHLPEGVHGYKILSILPDSSEQQDIREGEDDYVDLWWNYLRNQK